MTLYVVRHGETDFNVIDRYAQTHTSTIAEKPINTSKKRKQIPEI